MKAATNSNTRSFPLQLDAKDPKKSRVLSAMAEMHLDAMSEEAVSILSRTDTPALSPIDVLDKLVMRELPHFRKEQTQLRITNAGLPYPDALLRTEESWPSGLSVDKALQLTDLRWIAQGTNLFVSGPASSGKTLLACALAIRAAATGMSIRYVTALELHDQFSRTKYTPGIPQLPEELCLPDLLILDDLSGAFLTRFDKDSLGTILEARCGWRSTCILSRLPYDDWEKTVFFGCDIAKGALRNLDHIAEHVMLTTSKTPDFLDDPECDEFLPF